MTNIEISMRVEALVKNMINNFMMEQRVPATTMIQAINSVLVTLYPLAQQELLQSLDAEKIQSQSEKKEQIETSKAGLEPQKKEVK